MRRQSTTVVGAATAKASEASEVIRFVDGDEVIALAQELIRTPSGTFEEEAVTAILAERMRQLGLEVEVQEVRGPAELVTSQVVGRLRGTGGGRTLLYCGHLDTWASRRAQVWAADETADGEWNYFRPEEWTKEPFAGVIDDGWLYGVGALDQKSGIAAMVAAAAALARSGLEVRGDLIVAAFAAEGAGGYGSAQCIARGLAADCAVITEFTNLDLVISSVGGVMLRLTVEGDAKLFPPRIDAVEKMLSLLAVLGPFDTPLPADGWLRFTPEADLPGYPLLAVRELSSTLGTCLARLDLRTVPGVTAETVREDLERLLGELQAEDPDLRATVEVPVAPFIEWPAVATTDRESPLVRAISRRHEEVLGAHPAVGARGRLGAVSDKGHLVNGGIAEVVEYGPGLADPWPLADEGCAVADIVAAARVLALTAADLCS